jgi:hypothetical protein
MAAKSTWMASPSERALKTLFLQLFRRKFERPDWFDKPGDVWWRCVPHEPTQNLCDVRQSFCN